MNNVIQDVTHTTFSIIDGKLIEGTRAAIGLSGRNINLASLGKILRGYKTTKRRTWNDQKSIGVYYGMGCGLAYVVKVAVNGPTNLSIGCVEFRGNDAKTLRKAALKVSKVAA